jgi:hypothetical protein
MRGMTDFDWERDYGPIWRACPSAFWLAPEPGDRKRDVIDVRPKNPAQNTTWAHQMAALQQQGALQQAANHGPYMGYQQYRQPQGLFGFLGF